MKIFNEISPALTINCKSANHFVSQIHFGSQNQLIILVHRLPIPREKITPFNQRKSGGRNKKTNDLSDYHRHLLIALSTVTLHLVAGAA